MYYVYKLAVAELHLWLDIKKSLQSNCEETLIFQSSNVNMAMEHQKGHKAENNTVY